MPGLPTLCALMFLGASTYAITRIRPVIGPERLYWLVGIAVFWPAAFAALLQAAGFEEATDIYVQVMALAIALGPVCVLVAAISTLLQPLKESWASMILSVAAVVCIVGVLTGGREISLLLSIVALIGLIGLAISRFQAAPVFAQWLGLAAALQIAIPLMSRFAPTGLTPMDTGHLMLGAAIITMAEAGRRARGGPDYQD